MYMLIAAGKGSALRDVQVVTCVPIRTACAILYIGAQCVHDKLFLLGVTNRAAFDMYR